MKALLPILLVLLAFLWTSQFSAQTLQPDILQIANAYFGMYTRLRVYNVWRNFVSVAAPRNSQLWHRDPEDRYVLKAFVYLSDVDDGAGALTYAAGSHGKGELRRQPAFTRTKQDRARRSNDAQMAEVVPPERWVRRTGLKARWSSPILAAITREVWRRNASAFFICACSPRRPPGTRNPSPGRRSSCLLPIWTENSSLRSAREKRNGGNNTLDISPPAIRNVSLPHT